MRGLRATAAPILVSSALSGETPKASLASTALEEDFRVAVK